jgi:hypothetical protein
MMMRTRGRHLEWAKFDASPVELGAPRYRKELPSGECGACLTSIPSNVITQLFVRGRVQSIQGPPGVLAGRVLVLARSPIQSRFT